MVIHHSEFYDYMHWEIKQQKSLSIYMRKMTIMVELGLEFMNRLRTASIVDFPLFIFGDPSREFLHEG